MFLLLSGGSEFCLGTKKYFVQQQRIVLATNPTVGAGREVSIITCALSDHLTLFSLLANNKKLAECGTYEVSSNLTKVNQEII